MTGIVLTFRPPVNSPPFRVGDIVCLKSGSDGMTVLDVGPQGVLCAWPFLENGSLGVDSHTVNPACLFLIARPEWPEQR